VRESRSDDWKLASYEVAGGGGQKCIRAEGTMDGANVPSSFQDGNFRGRYQTLRVWLISGCPCRDDYLPVLVRKSFSRRAKARAKAAGGCQFEKSGGVIFADGCRQLVAPEQSEGGWPSPGIPIFNIDQYALPDAFSMPVSVKQNNH
jgi:hypothetical protein